MAGLIVSVLRRRRWAWFVFAVFQGFVLISFAWSFTSAVGLLGNLVSFGLLISPPMRAFVFGSRRRCGPPAGADVTQ
jgi:hypothetical protein